MNSCIATASGGISPGGKLGSAQTGTRRERKIGLQSLVHPENATMRFDRPLSVLAVLTVFLAGCGNQAAPVAPADPVATTTVGTEIDDTVVTTRVKSALLADADVKSFDFKVETRKGVVQLSGFVDSQAQIDRAIVATRAVEGVLGVVNEMSVKK